jgi:hypothetical protein
MPLSTAALRFVWDPCESAQSRGVKFHAQHATTRDSRTMRIILDPDGHSCSCVRTLSLRRQSARLPGQLAQMY